jgi:hypothetical protein
LIAFAIAVAISETATDKTTERTTALVRRRRSSVSAASALPLAAPT